MTTSFRSLPIIDFKALKDEKTKDEALQKLKHALFDVGFLYLANTGLEVGPEQPKSEYIPPTSYRT